jgi:hypothetical protein
MKFGKRLLREQAVGWRLHYVNYKARKAPKTPPRHRRPTPKGRAAHHAGGRERLHDTIRRAGRGRCGAARVLRPNVLRFVLFPATLTRYRMRCACGGLRAAAQAHHRAAWGRRHAVLQHAGRGAGTRVRVLYRAVVRARTHAPVFTHTRARLVCRRVPNARVAAAARSDKLTAQLDGLERTVRPAPAELLGGGASSSATAPAAASPAALAAAQRALVSDLVPQLGALRLFVVLNYTAVVKARCGAARTPTPTAMPRPRPRPHAHAHVPSPRTKQESG